MAVGQGRFCSSPSGNSGCLAPAASSCFCLCCVVVTGSFAGPAAFATSPAFPPASLGGGRRCSRRWGASCLYQLCAARQQGLHGSTDAFDFQVLVLCLCDTRVKLEIHLSLPDNNVQNGTSCMNHYLQPGVVLLMNMHEPGDRRRDWHNLPSGEASDGSARGSEVDIPGPRPESVLALRGQWCPGTVGGPRGLSNAAACSFRSRHSAEGQRAAGADRLGRPEAVRVARWPCPQEAGRETPLCGQAGGSSQTSSSVSRRGRCGRGCDGPESPAARCDLGPSLLV